MGWMNVLVRFLMLGPIALGVIAAGFFGAGYYLQIFQNERFARNAELLALGMPEVVNAEAYDEDVHMRVNGEAHIQAQVLMESIYELTIEKDFGEDYALMVPLLATDATSARVVGVALYTGSDVDFSELTDGRILAKTEDMGALGPIARFNGYAAGGLGAWSDLVKDSFADEGLTWPSNPVIIQPYLGGRHANLPTSGDDTMTLFGLFSKIGGAIGLLALLKLVIRGDSAKKDEDTLLPEAHEPLSTFHMPETPAPAPVSEPGVPLWKQRLMDKHQAEYGTEDMAQTYEPPVDNEPDFDAPPAPSYNIISEDTGIATKRFSYEPKPVDPPVGEAPTIGADTPLISEPPRRGGGLRKVLIAIVGGAFALALVATLAGLMGDALANEQAQVAPVDPARALAEALAYELVPAADPDRPFSQVDVTPVARWFIVTGMMAFAGDTTAIITLASIVLALFLSGFVFRYYFFVRSALRGTGNAYTSFADMGIN